MSNQGQAFCSKLLLRRNPPLQAEPTNSRELNFDHSEPTCGLLFRLHPPVLEEEGLVAALQARLEAIEARAGLQIDLQVEGENRLPIAIEDELYKIAQEALNNVVKHAKAEQVTVHLRFTDQACWLTIQDDGVGFDPAAVQREGGLGLRNIAERIQQMDGTLLVESTPTGGTKLQAMVKTQLVAAKGGSEQSFPDNRE